MKKSLLFVALISVLVAFKPAEVYKVDVEKSKINWVGRKVTGEHSGNIKLSSGTLNYSDSKLTGGSFAMDMNSIKVTDITGEYATKLEGHLKNDDFFATDKHATAKFVITKVTSTGAGKANITGNLTIKGITQPLTFPATISSKNGEILAVANAVKVNRAKYDIRYGSKSFFDSLGDKAIDDDFELNINLVAKK